MNEKIIKILKISFIVVGCLIFYHIQVPNGLTPEAWKSAIIFLGVIVAVMLNVMPIGLLSFVGIALYALLNVSGQPSAAKSVTFALSGFNSSLIWLIVVAFFIARGFIKTGFGRRIALVIIRYFGKNTLGLTYGLALADLVLAPFTPSNTARCGGVIYPITNSIAHSLQSNPEDPSRMKIGRFLIAAIGNINDITALLFVTAYAANPLIIKLATEFGVELNWTSWLTAALVPGLVSLAIIPLFLFFYLKPELKKIPDAVEFSKQELIKLGPINSKEIILAVVLVVLIGMWIFGSSLGIHSTTAALLGLSALLLTDVLNWEDIKNEKSAWDTLIWFSALLMMANAINQLGFAKWVGSGIGNFMSGQVEGIHWGLILFILNFFYILIHYFFASGTAQVAALYTVFLGVSQGLNIPVYPAALMLAFSSSYYCSLTQYAHARGPILFGAGYLTTKEWWLTGFFACFINQVIFITIGLIWWKILGLY